MSLRKLLEATARLSNLQRYSMERLTAPESVLEHVGMTAIICLVLATEVDGIAGDEVDIGSVLSKAIVHDFDELVTGDIPRSTKYSSAEALAMFKSLSVQAVDQLAVGEFASFPKFASAMRWHHGNAKDGSREGAIVSLADILAVVYKFWYEVGTHSNRSFAHKAVDALAQLEAVRSKIRAAEFSSEAEAFLDAIVNSGVAIMGEVR